MNLFEQYGIKEVADVCLYAIELDENDDEVYVPVLYMDTLKVSTVEESTSQSSAQGGIGNPKLITWDYGKDITVTLEDALFTPASASMNWGGKLGAKGLKLHLRYFFDRNTDNGTPDTCLRTATLIADEFSDFLIIPDRWPPYEKKQECGSNSESRQGYVGGTSIYCWKVNGYIVSDDDRKRVSFEKLILFYREQTQQWYFFNVIAAAPELGYPDINSFGELAIITEENLGDGQIRADDSSKVKIYRDRLLQNSIAAERVDIFGDQSYDWNLIAEIILEFAAEQGAGLLPYKEGDENYDRKNWFYFLYSHYGDRIVSLPLNFSQYGDYWFQWIKDHICQRDESDTKEYYFEQELVEKVTWNHEHETTDDIKTPWFLTQNLYIDGYRPGCARDKKYSQMTYNELSAFYNKKYIPYRYFANIGVEYNTNVVPPQDVIYQFDTAYNNETLIERIEKCQATQTFCIDTDANMKHGQYRFLYQYSQMELTVFIDPKTMQPYQPNTFEYYRKNGQRITGNLRVIRCGEYYYKWTRQKAKSNEALGRQIIIDAEHYPGTYRLVGETIKRDRYGMDHRYQFEIPLCKLHSDNKLTLQADGDPTVFSMKLTALRRFDGVMMKLTEYETTDQYYDGYKSGSSVVTPFIGKEPELNPQPYTNGKIDLEVFDIEGDDS